MNIPTVNLGVIGGSGLYKIDKLENVREISLETPFGKPSDTITIGRIGNTDIAFLPRHARGHVIMPTEIPNRANIYAMKLLGVERIISISAVGSLREAIHPLDLVIPDQLIDRTRLRDNTFFGNGVTAHISFAEPFCPELSDLLAQSGRNTDTKIHKGGTCIVMEGPAFSTIAESHLYRSWGADIIGMTALPEAKLAREAEICYSMLACVTDYDVWHKSESTVTVDMIVANLFKNVAVAQQVLLDLVSNLTKPRSCGCVNALKDTIITAPEKLDQEIDRRLSAIIGKYHR